MKLFDFINEDFGQTGSPSPQYQKAADKAIADERTPVGRSVHNIEDFNNLTFGQQKRYLGDGDVRDESLDIDEVAGAKDCWDGYKKDGTQPGTGKNKGKRVNKCVKETDVAENIKGGLDSYYQLTKAKRLAKADGHDYDKLPEYHRGKDQPHKEKYMALAKEKNSESVSNEGKSPHKKGTTKYKKHMAAMHAEDVQLEDNNDMPDLSDDMIGTPDDFYDAEQRQEAYRDLKDATDDCRHDWQKDTVIDGICPDCTGSSCMDGDDENGEDSCYGWGNFGCDGGEMTQRDDGLPNWAEIIKHDKRKAERDDAKANYPGDEEVVKQIANMVKGMDDPRMALQQMAIDYPQMGRRQRANLVAQGMKAAGLTKEDVNFEEGTIDQTFATDNIDKHDKKSKKREKENKQKLELELIKKLSGIKKVEENPNFLEPLSRNTDKSGAGVPDYIQRGNIRYQFFPNEINADGSKGLWVADGDPKQATKYPANSRVGQALLKQRANALAKTTPSYKAKLKNDIYSEDAEGDSNEAEIAKIIAKALGDSNRWTEMSAQELYAELESVKPDLADTIKDIGRMIYGVRLAERSFIKIDKNSKEVTLEDNQDFNEEFGVLGYSEDEEHTFEAEYQGRNVKLNKPMQGDVKKFKVYVKDPKTGNVKKVNFGHGGTSAKRKTMRIRKSNPKARKSFRARHNCANPGPKTKARYWSCRKW